MKYLKLLVVLLVVSSCETEQSTPTLFSKIPSSESNLESSNDIEHTDEFNIFNYRNFFNGAGVAIGDINNDGLSDVYLTNNMKENRLYINKGKFKFEDVTASSGASGNKKWSTGVVMVDINYDGLLDIYVCNAGYEKGSNQENELFINNGDLTFTEKAAEYGLNNNGYTTHAAFFDYDLDGDLDVYILNNSFIPVNTLNYSNKRDLAAEDWPVKDFLKGGGDKLLRNDNGKFTNVTKEAGIFSSLIGFGLGVTVGDINDDNYPDIYVSNDFFERDYLYINQKDGTFQDDIVNQMAHISLASMGADMADVNNDGHPEVFVTEMLPYSNFRVNTISNFEQYSVYDLKLKRDFHHQYMHNTLQLNNQNSTFSEMAWYGGVSASDWSWGALLFDANNDGFRDIYVSNGLPRDLTDQDFIDFFANDVIQQMALSGKKEEVNKIINKMPTTPILNNFFVNQGDLTFKEEGVPSGFDVPSFSNGAAYGDLDNDGDLDLVVNNTNKEVFLFKNNANELTKNHFLSVQLVGTNQNTKALGSKVNIYANGQIFNTEVIPSRGFQSSVDYKIVQGLGEIQTVDSLVVKWYDNTFSTVENPPIDTLLILDYSKVDRRASRSDVTEKNTLLVEVSNKFETHQEDEYVDFYREGLIIKMLSKEGPSGAKGDVNGDGKEDIYIGGAREQEGQLYIGVDGGFVQKKVAGFENDLSYEDTFALFADFDGDGDEDLFVGTGGNLAPERSRILQDRIYLNDGKGNFTQSKRALPMNGYNTSVAVAFDYDKDGDQDLFVGSRSIPNVYGVTPPSFLFQNNGSAQFKHAPGQTTSGISNVGMVTDAKLVNLSGDDNTELVIVGEWEAPRVFSFSNGNIQEVETNLKDYSGWWYAVEKADVDNDGDQDLILGNRGENFYFTGTVDRPAKLWLSDFDKNGTIEKIITQNIGGKDMPISLKKELTSQIVSLKKKNLNHADYANRSIQELFGDEVLAKAKLKVGNYFKSAVAINQGNGNFELMALPTQVQLSCVCDILCIDLNKDTYLDLILGGNDSGFTPQFSRLDGSYGHVLLNNQSGEFDWLGPNESGFSVKGDIKRIIPIEEEKSILVLVNNDKPKLFNIK